MLRGGLREGRAHAAGQCPHLHARQVDKIAQCAELPHAQHWYQVSALLHGKPHKPCAQLRGWSPEAAV